MSDCNHKATGVACDRCGADSVACDRCGADMSEDWNALNHELESRDVAWSKEVVKLRAHIAELEAALAAQVATLTRERDEARADAAQKGEALKLTEEALTIHVMADAVCEMGADAGDELAVSMARAALASTPAPTIDNQRMLDLLRVCRSELLIEHKLIDEKEYAWLASLPSQATHARLADYDKLRARIAELEAALAKVVDALEDMAEDRQQTDELSEMADEALAAAREVSK